jgi:hypothetical protein
VSGSSFFSSPTSLLTTDKFLSSFHTFTLIYNLEGEKHLVVPSLCVLWLYVNGNFKEFQTNVNAVSDDQKRDRKLLLQHQQIMVWIFSKDCKVKLFLCLIN